MHWAAVPRLELGHVQVRRSMEMEMKMKMESRATRRSRKMRGLGR